jgi:hypothetical protein
MAGRDFAVGNRPSPATGDDVVDDVACAVNGIAVPTTINPAPKKNGITVVVNSFCFMVIFYDPLYG